VLSDVIVTTQMGGGWRDVWLHQVRWSRTIRVSNFWGYLGLPVTLAMVWVLVLLGMREWVLALVVLTARMLMATCAGWWVLEARDTLRLWLLIPARDLFGAAVWLTALFGRTVMWRGQQLRLDPAGKIVQ
jgi:ceramide glucosyltransferase